MGRVSCCTKNGGVPSSEAPYSTLWCDQCYYHDSAGTRYLHLCVTLIATTPTTNIPSLPLPSPSSLSSLQAVPSCLSSPRKPYKSQYTLRCSPECISYALDPVFDTRPTRSITQGCFASPTRRSAIYTATSQHLCVVFCVAFAGRLLPFLLPEFHLLLLSSTNLLVVVPICPHLVYTNLTAPCQKAKPGVSRRKRARRIKSIPHHPVLLAPLQRSTSHLLSLGFPL